MVLPVKTLVNYAKINKNESFADILQILQFINIKIDLFSGDF